MCRHDDLDPDPRNKYCTGDDDRRVNFHTKGLHVWRNNCNVQCHYHTHSHNATKSVHLQLLLGA